MVIALLVVVVLLVVMLALLLVVVMLLVVVVAAPQVMVAVVLLLVVVVALLVVVMPLVKMHTAEKIGSCRYLQLVSTCCQFLWVDLLCHWYPICMHAQIKKNCL